jgi:hypothetical protein
MKKLKFNTVTAFKIADIGSTFDPLKLTLTEYIVVSLCHNAETIFLFVLAYDIFVP